MQCTVYVNTGNTLGRFTQVLNACNVTAIIPGCFGLGGGQSQFCTSLHAQFDVV